MERPDTEATGPDAFEVGGGDVELTLWVRSDVPRTVVDDLSTTIRAFDPGSIEGVEFTVELHPARVDVDTCNGTHLMRRYEDWLDLDGHELRPYFDLRETVCRFTDRVQRVLRPPVVCLSVDVAGEPRTVYPSKKDGRHVTVDEGIREIESSLPPSEGAEGLA